MRTLPFLVVSSAVCCLPLVAYAHTGGALDVEGCHPDHRKGTYHCHRGDAAGYTFPDRPAMLEAVRTGKFPEKSVEAEGFFDKLWPWGNKHEQQEAPEAATGDADAKPAADAPAAVAPAQGATPPTDSPVVVSPSPSPSSSPSAAPVAPAAPAAPQSEPERRLKVLQGLYEMGLISREEYEAKRKEVLGQL
jgi:hypothetical protein